MLFFEAALLRCPKCWPKHKYAVLDCGPAMRTEGGVRSWKGRSEIKWREDNDWLSRPVLLEATGPLLVGHPMGDCCLT